jgi:phage regulator Rha-like protein
MEFYFSEMPYKRNRRAVVPQPVTLDVVQNRIHLIRGQKVMLDAELAALYGVGTKILNKAVQRNPSRFPVDFMFQLTPQEVANLRFQIGTSSSGYGGRRYRPYAFTEQGVAMLSSVLNSERAVQVNILIVRAFVQLRSLLASHRDLAEKLAELEQKLEGHDVAIRNLFDAIRAMVADPPGPKRLIGFNREQPA